MRDIQTLWESIRNHNFDDPIDGATAAAIQSRAAVLRNGGEPTAADFATNDKVARLGGIFEVRRAIERDWTIEEVKDFFGAWNDETSDVKKTLMGGGEDAENRVQNFTAALSAVYESGLIAIGAKCYADCKRNDTYLALGFDTQPYYRQTLKDIERTLPPPLVKKLDSARNECLDANDRTQQLIHDRFEGLKPTQAGVDYLVGKKTQRTRNAKKAQAKSVDMYAAEKQRAADDMHRALERVRDDPGVKAGTHGAMLAACRRLCDWTDKAGHVHHGKFEPLTTSKKHGEPQYAPLMDWRGKPIKPETLARNYRDSRKKPKAKRGTK